MSKEKCYLCGGKLVNGWCPECGLDNAKSQNKKYWLNKSRLENKMKSQEEAKELKERTDKEAKPQKAVPKVGYSSSEASNSRVKQWNKRTVASKKRYKAIFAVLGIAVMLIGFISDLVLDHKADVVNILQESSVQVEEHNPYEYVTRELAADGDFFEKELEPGKYQAGVHLPEGNYRVSLSEGNGTVTVHDYENSIYLWQSIGKNEENDELQEWEDVRIYQGAKIEIRGDVRVRLTTESAQSAKMAELQANPLSENILLKRGREVTAGVDFPEGIYDFEAASEWTSVVYNIPLYTDYEEEELNFLTQSIFITTDELDSTYRNVVIPAGTTVIAEEADVRMVPSELIETEDYDSYYDEYR